MQSTKNQSLRSYPEYGAWKRMHQRCNDPNVPEYARYGGRGIQVCPEWKSFLVFISDMGSRPSSAHTLDRIDNDLGYAPENCRWATRKDQSRNQASNKMLEMNGETLSMAEWCERLEVNYYMVRSRLRLGWDAQRALTTPSHIPAEKTESPFESRGDKHWSKLAPERLSRGEKHGGSKLTDALVLEIRSLYSPRKFGYSRLAKRFGVSKTLIEVIIKRKNWAHI